MRKTDTQPQDLSNRCNHTAPDRPKLVIVEGVMGAGKSSTAQYIDSYLRERGIPTQLFLEGNLDHPADFEFVACLNREEYASLLHQHAEHEALLREIVVPQGADALIFYEKEWRRLCESFPQNLYDQLATFDIYNGLALDKHQELLLQRWTQFAENQMQQETTVILECCFLQNPMCKFLAQHNAGAEAVIEHTLHIAEIVQPLQPVLVYLPQSKIRETIDRASRERPQAWLDFVIGYHTEQAYGQANGLQGVEGFLQFLEARQALELEICNRLPGAERTLLLEDAGAGGPIDWPTRLERLAKFMDAVFQF